MEVGATSFYCAKELKCLSGSHLCSHDNTARKKNGRVTEWEKVDYKGIKTGEGT